MCKTSSDAACGPKELSHKAVLAAHGVPNTAEKLGKMLSNVEARDKLLKLSSYTTRLLRHFEVVQAAAMRDNLAQADASIVQARQITNTLKYIESVAVFIRTARDPAQRGLRKAVLLTRIFFWTMEVVSSDLTFLARFFFHTWDRERIGYYYKMGKSLQLTLLALLEGAALLKIFRAAKRALEKKRAAEARGGEVRPAAAVAVAWKEDRAEVVSKLQCLVRCFCDCYIYYTWVPGYQPNKGLSYAAGFTSALVGLHGQAAKHGLA